MLAKTDPVTYKIQRHARADPEFVHVDKLLLYQADSIVGSMVKNQMGDGLLGCKPQTTRPLSSHLKLQ